MTDRHVNASMQKWNSSEDKDSFWGFRCKDISEQYIFYLGITTSWQIIGSASYLADLKGKSIIPVLVNIFVVAIGWIAWSVRKRYLKWFIYCLPVFALLDLFSFLYQCVAILGTQDGEEKVKYSQYVLANSSQNFFVACLIITL